MHSRLSGLALALCLGASGLGVSVGTSTAWAQPKNKKPTVEAGDKSFEKQSAWEQKVMGEDGAKQADMKKIAAAQKLAEEARKNPPPEPVKKVKDPNKEGVRAKSEASIGLPIESEQAQKTTPKKATVAKKSDPAGSANDELGALVASSLASEKKAESAPAADAAPARRGKGRAKGKAAAKAEEPSSLDRIFSAGK
jgi:hypothetical protein